MDSMSKADQDSLAFRLMNKVKIEKTDTPTDIMKKIKDALQNDKDKRGRNLLKPKNWKYLIRNIFPIIYDEKKIKVKDDKQKGIFDFG
jgi:hypothetical protein